MKTIIFILCLTASFWGWMVAEYDRSAVRQLGYAPEHRAELQGKIDGLVPLSVADLSDE